MNLIGYFFRDVDVNIVNIYHNTIFLHGNGRCSKPSPLPNGLQAKQFEKQKLAKGAPKSCI